MSAYLHQSNSKLHLFSMSKMASDSEIQSEFRGDQKTQKKVSAKKRGSTEGFERSNRLNSLNKHYRLCYIPALYTEQQIKPQKQNSSS